MMRRDGDRLVVSGALTLAGAAAALEEGRAAIAAGARRIDLGEVGELDSSALALLLAWARDARAKKVELAFDNLPQGLTAIARLYGVAEMLPAGPAAAHHH
jgi:phospholipid transport system transporter-binding protein